MRISFCLFPMRISLCLFRMRISFCLFPMCISFCLFRKHISFCLFPDVNFLMFIFFCFSFWLYKFSHTVLCVLILSAIQSIFPILLNLFGGKLQDQYKWNVVHIRSLSHGSIFNRLATHFSTVRL